MDFTNVIKGLEQVRQELPKITEIIIEQSKTKILDLIREDQLFERGIDGTGQPLQPYAPFTIAVKRAEGRDPNIVTLFDTGDFYRGFDLLFTDQFSVGVFSRDDKTPKLVQKYGNEIFTFTIENNQVLNEDIIKPQLIEWILQQIQTLLTR